MNNKKISISIVNYTNTLPFKWALKKSALIEKTHLEEDIPSICAQKLKYKQVDLALVPVALLPELDSYFIETDFCIGTLGVVDSVKLYSNTPLSEIKTITLDYQSKSSITLTRVLCKFFWKINPEFIEAKPGYEKNLAAPNANVVIGDRTFALNGSFKYEFDLAVEWKKFTGLPFVFAAWVSTEKLNQDFMAEFNSVLKFGVENCNKAIEESAGTLTLTKEKAVEYLTKRIDYHLDSEKRKALNLFLEYIRKL
ncbi:MAG: Chorismate dehydratase [Bacteroidetes bacterium]|nr:Chorismate dehydratase [Bacteroidota bacterium]